MKINTDFSGVGADLYMGSPDEPQPDWRKDDSDDQIDDNDDPAPIGAQMLVDMLGFDPAEEDEEDEDEDINDKDEDDEDDEDLDEGFID